jgi:hypothetical protein
MFFTRYRKTWIHRWDDRAELKDMSLSAATTVPAGWLNL